jgi:probable rRNA maturation factor
MSNSIQFLGKSKFISGKQRKAIRQMIETIAHDHGYIIQNICYIFMKDDELLEINQSHLQHDDYTDIITFDLSDTEACIDGEIYISIDRIADNAIKFNCTKEDELIRVLSHGVLHLMGYKDKSENDSKNMRDAENLSIKIYHEIPQ